MVVVVVWYWWLCGSGGCVVLVVVWYWLLCGDLVVFGVVVKFSDGEEGNVGVGSSV